MTWLLFVAFYLKSDGLPWLGWIAFAAAVVWDWHKERKEAKANKAFQENLECALGQIANTLFKIELQQMGYKVSTEKGEMTLDGKKLDVTLNKVYAPATLNQEVLDASRESCGCWSSDLWHETGQHEPGCPNR